MSETLESLRSSFYRSLRVEGKATRTITLYGQSITYFSRWLTEQGCDADLDNLNRDTVVRWLDHLRELGLAPGTILTRWRGLRRFVNWLLTEGIIDTDFLVGISVEKPEPPPVPVFTDEDLAALIAACKGKAFRERRDEAMIAC